MTQVLSQRKMCVVINLRSHPGNYLSSTFSFRAVNSANELIYRVMEDSGYMLPSSDYFTRWLFKEKNPEKKPSTLTCFNFLISTGIEKAEIDKAFQAIRLTLETEKERGWHDGIPVLCLANLGRRMDKITVLTLHRLTCCSIRPRQRR